MTDEIISVVNNYDNTDVSDSEWEAFNPLEGNNSKTTLLRPIFYKGISTIPKLGQ